MIVLDFIQIVHNLNIDSLGSGETSVSKRDGLSLKIASSL